MTTRYQGKEDEVRSVVGTNVFEMNRFLNEVVKRSYEGVKEKIQTEHARRQASDDILDHVALLIMKSTDASIFRDMGVGFCISIQSIWERGFRRFVGRCAQQIPDTDALKLAMSPRWEEARDGFELVHGSKFKEFPEFDSLDLLHTLGNVCRHGPGKSMDRLMAKHPEFWPTGVATSDPYRPMRDLLISEAHLSQFADAAVSFWRRIDHQLYTQQYTEEERTAMAEADEAFAREGIQKARDRFRAGLIEHLVQTNPALRSKISGN